MVNPSEAFSIAIQHHQAGRLQAAEKIYRQILAIDPNHADALHLLGVIASQVGKHEVAVEYIERAIRLQGNAAFFHNNLAEAYRALHRNAEAVACYRRALELKPDSAEVHNNLGCALKNQGRLDEAVACYRRALELKPNFAEMHGNLGNALKEQGKLDEAVACYRRALELKPNFAEMHSNLGAAFREQEKLDEAVACYRRALELKPDFADAHNNLGNVLNKQGKSDEAAVCFRRALKLKPDYVEAQNNLGNALKDQEKLDEAVACYRRALELKPDFAEAHSNLGNVLNNQGKLDEAVACYRRALELKPDFAEVHSNLANALKDQGKLDEALACCRRALELKPDCAVAHNTLGSVLQQVGDLRGAEECFRAALRCNPRFGFAHLNLAGLLGGKLPENDLAAQRRLLEERELPDAQRLSLHFALAQSLDARGEYAEAAEHLARGNALQLACWRKRGQEYDPKQHESFVARTIAVCTPDFFEHLRSFGSKSDLPVFVVGLPRSGTTLIEQILASHSQVFGAGEITLVQDTLDGIDATALAGQARNHGQGKDFIERFRHLDRKTSRRLAARHLERLQALSPAALRVVDKMPDNYLFLGHLASLFPRAKFIHCRRDLRDTALSCWMTHFQDIPWANDQQHIASRFQEYCLIMDHWREVLPAPVLEAEYEETVADLEGVARKLIAWCGLAWEPACLEFHRSPRSVRTASFVQVRQPIYSRSVGRWKHYERELASLFERLENRDTRNNTIGSPSS